MAEELYINDLLIELPERAVAQTKQINDVGEVKDRQANYSNSIKVPRTPNNIKAFEMLGIAGNTTRVQYVNAGVKYVVDGIELISEGKGVIKNTNDFYNIVVYDGAISLSDLLGNDTLEDLDFSTYNHDLTTALFTSSFSNTAGYIYALGMFYENANKNIIAIDQQNVSFYVHTLFDMIFTQKGYTVAGSFFSDADYRKRLLSMDIGYDRTRTESETQVYTDSSPVTVLETFGTTETTKEYTIDSYTATATEIHRIVISGSFTLSIGKNPLLKIYVGGTLTDTSILGSIFDTDIALNVNSGQLIEVKIQVTSELDLGQQTISFIASPTTTIYEKTIEIPIDISSIIGDQRQIDFVKDIMQRYGLIFRKTRNKQEFEFIRMEDLLADKANAEDWSGKYSAFQDEAYKPSYAQKNLFKFTYDSVDTNEDQTFADGEMLVDNVNLEKEKTLLTSIFKASVFKDPYYVLNHWTLDDNVITPSKDGLRIFERKDVVTTIDYRFGDDISNPASFTGAVPYLDFEPVKYQNEVDDNYTEFKSMLDDYHKVILELNLNIIDIYNLDFFKLKFFNQLGQFYYLNKVRNFRKNRKTVCEFIRIGKA